MLQNHFPFCVDFSLRCISVVVPLRSIDIIVITSSQSILVLVKKMLHYGKIYRAIKIDIMTISNHI